jgi:hypothetical protein
MCAGKFEEIMKDIVFHETLSEGKGELGEDLQQ